MVNASIRSTGRLLLLNREVLDLSGVKIHLQGLNAGASRQYQVAPGPTPAGVWRGWNRYRGFRRHARYDMKVVADPLLPLGCLPESLIRHSRSTCGSALWAVLRQQCAVIDNH